MTVANPSPIAVEPDLPEGWASVPLMDVCGLIRGVSYKKGEETSEPKLDFIPLLRANNINGTINFENIRFVPPARVSEEQRLRQGDIVIAMSSGSKSVVGKAATLTKEWNGTFGAFCGVLRPISSLDWRYFGFFFQTSWYREYISELAAGVNINNLRREYFEEMRFPFAPPDEQGRIANKIAQVLTRVNATRARLARISIILKRFRQAVLAAAFSGRLTADWRTRTPVEDIEETLKRVHVPASKTGREATDNIIPGVCILSVGNPHSAAPSGWRWTPLIEIAKLESGHTPSRKHPEYWGGKIPWIGILDAGAHHGRVILQTKQTVTQLGLENSAARLLPPRTVCLSRTASVGYVLIMGRTMATSQDFVNWVCSDALVPEFLMYALMAEGEDIKRFGRGSTHTTIYFPEVKALHICLPSVSEQREIVRRIEASLASADTIKKHVAAATMRAEKLTQAILAKAFRGELVPTEAELARREGRSYEPASVLLERIRAPRRQSTGSSE